MHTLQETLLYSEYGDYELNHVEEKKINKIKMVYIGTPQYCDYDLCSNKDFYNKIKESK